FDHALDVLILGALGAQEFASCGNVEEEISHLYRRAGRTRRRPGRAQLTVVGADRVSDLRVGSSRDEPHARDRCDARQRFAAETERRDLLEIVDRRDLARRMARQRERELLPFDPRPVIANAAQTHAAIFDLHLDALRTGIDAVLHELLDYGCRSFDDLARRDLMNELLGKNSDGHGAAHVEPRAEYQTG